MTLYEIRELRFEYPGRFRLEIDEFRLETGERVAVTGANGAGKTTLLRILAFLERPSSWKRFRFLGRDVGGRGVRRNGLGVLRQQPWIFRGTVFDNLAFGLAVRRYPAPEIRRRVETLADRLDLGPLLRHPARSLSGGEQKRLAFGRVLVTEPDVLLLDEPAAHLDRVSDRIIHEVLAETPSTVLLTTHDLHAALAFSHRTLTLKEGRVSDDLPLNVFEGACSDGVLTTRRGLVIRLSSSISAPSRKVTVDPRSIVLSLEPLASGRLNVFPGRISAIESHGENVRIEIESTERFETFLSRRSYEELNLNLLRPVFVSFEPDAVRLL